MHTEKRTRDAGSPGSRMRQEGPSLEPPRGTSLPGPQTPASRLGRE